MDFGEYFKWKRLQSVHVSLVVNRKHPTLCIVLKFKAVEVRKRDWINSFCELPLLNPDGFEKTAFLSWP